MNRRERIAMREAQALVEQKCEEYVRNKMRPSLVSNARHATANFFRRGDVARSSARR